MRISVHAGHNQQGKVACGAIGILDESKENRIVKKYVIQYLKEQGHTVFDDTVDNASSVNDNLVKIKNNVNSHPNLDLAVSIHFNCGANDKSGNGKNTGTEVWIYGIGGQAEKYAKTVVNAIATDCGFTNRGVKTSTGLYITKNTYPPCILIECCFVDDKDDVKLYNAEKMARAIVRGITGKKVEMSSAKPVTQTTSSFKVKITSNTLNVRSGAGTSFNIVTTVQKGDVFTIVDQTENWYKLKSGAGWIAKKYTVKI